MTIIIPTRPVLRLHVSEAYREATVMTDLPAVLDHTNNWGVISEVKLTSEELDLVGWSVDYRAQDCCKVERGFWEQQAHEGLHLLMDSRRHKA